MQLDVYRVARDIVTKVVALGVTDAEFESQVTRAAKSLPLNLAEGLPSRSAGMRRRFFAIAYEVAAAADAAALLGVADRAAVGEVLALLRPRQRAAEQAAVSGFRPRRRDGRRGLVCFVAAPSSLAYRTASRWLWTSY